MMDSCGLIGHRATWQRMIEEVALFLRTTVGSSAGEDVTWLPRSS